MFDVSNLVQASVYHKTSDWAESGSEPMKKSLFIDCIVMYNSIDLVLYIDLGPESKKAIFSAVGIQLKDKVHQAP